MIRIAPINQVSELDLKHKQRPDVIIKAQKETTPDDVNYWELVQKHMKEDKE